MKKALIISVALVLLAASLVGAETYTVKSGDTLYSLSKRFHVPVAELKAANGLSSSSIRAGQKLNILKTGHAGQNTGQSAGRRTYTVKKGDTLGRIAKRFGTTAKEIKRINGLDSSRIFAKQKLLIDEEVREAKSAETAAAEARITEAKIIESLSAVSNAPNMDIKERLMLVAEMMLDIPYKFGGSSFKGMDCSAYVQKAFGFVDILLPRAAREQFKVGMPISKEELSIGDLVFFKTYAKFPSHVGIYIRDNLFLHASSVDKKVTIGRLDAPYYAKRFIGAKRLIPEAEAAGEDGPAKEEKTGDGNI